MDVTNKIEKIEVTVKTESSNIELTNVINKIPVTIEVCDNDIDVTGVTANVYNSVGGLIVELNSGETYFIPKHTIKKQSGTIVAQQEFNEDFAIQNTIVTDNGVQHEVEYGNTYTCSTLQERIIYVDFSEGKTITIPITTKNRGTYTTLTTTLTATINKNGNVVTLPFTVVTGDSLTIDVTANGTLELGGTYE